MLPQWVEGSGWSVAMAMLGMGADGING
jgi:hypothetical protein